VLGGRVSEDHGLVSPLLAQVRSHEVFLSDCTRFTKHEREAGVNVTLEVWQGMQHVRQYSAGVLPKAPKAIDGIGEVVAAASGQPRRDGQTGLVDTIRTGGEEAFAMTSRRKRIMPGLPMRG
jgi:hypothetical protein